MVRELARIGRARSAAVCLIGALLTLAGMVMIAGVAIQAGQAAADTAPFELFCTGTPLGDLALNDVVITGRLSPASPSPGQQFNLEDFQTQITIPADIVQQAAAVGNTSLSGTATTTILAAGATPSTLSTGPLAYDEPIPGPVPTSGLQFDVPTTPATLGPFTATSDNVSLSLGSSIELTFADVALSGLPPFSCSAYPNDVIPAGLVGQLPPGLPVSPVIAFAGTPPPPTPTGGPTGPYELYCPHTPVGDLDFNNVTSSATITPSSLSAGDQFQVTDYQIAIPVPPGPVTAAVGLSNSSFDGLAASYVDAYGATAAQLPTGSMGFDVPIPNPVPTSGVEVDIPSSPITIGPFTASGGPVTIAQDQSILVVAELSGKAFKMSCTAYANDALATSGSTGLPPPATPIRPIIATASASGTPGTTTTTVPTGPGPQTPGAPYELYCPGTPVGDIAVDDVVTTASITPTSLNEGDSFQLTGLQTQFTIPQSIAQQAENLGLTTLSGDLSLFLDVTGTEYGVYPVTGTSSTSNSGSSSASSSTPTTVVSAPPVPVPYPSSGEVDLSFQVTLPSPVPSGGVQFTATAPPGYPVETFVAAGGPIQVLVSGVNLEVNAFGDQFGLFCDTLAAGSVPTGLSIQEPYNDFVEPLVTTGSATTIPAQPGPPGAYELYCPGTPVGNVVLNDAETSGTIPQALSAGQNFNVTGYQTTVIIPPTIVSAAAALGETSLNGSASTALDASGATPSSISTGPMDFDVPIPTPVPTEGVTLVVPSSASTVGPFTATASAVAVEEDSMMSLTLTISGNSLNLRCTAYPDNSLPTGITTASPSQPPISPVIATSGPALIVSPDSELTGGENVTVTGSGFADSSPGNILECNETPDQPTVALGSPVNGDLPVGCTAPSYSLVTTSATGTISTSYAITEGTVGPPCGASSDVITTCPSTDSAGQDPATDSANYPCPPTPTQQAAGVTCVLRYGDEAGDSATAPIFFPSETTPPPPTTGGSGPYELYCPGTPVGTIAINDVTTTGTITPANPATGSTFEVTDYQTQLSIPQSIASAAAALGNSAITGSATTTLDVTGATPASLASPTMSFDDPIPDPVPSTGVTLDLPSPSTSLGPFTATGGAITISQSDQTSLDLVVSGNTLNLSCTSYPNNDVPTGITTSTPSGSPISPEVASATTATSTTTSTTSTSTTTSSTTTTSTASSTTTSTLANSSTTTSMEPSSTTTTTVAPVTASSGSLAFTGPGQALRLTAALGAGLLLLGLLLLLLADVPRQLLRRLACAHLPRWPTLDLRGRDHRAWLGPLAHPGALAHSATARSRAFGKTITRIAVERGRRLLGR